MNRLSRATALKIAAVLSLLLGLYSFMNFLPYLVRGAADLDQGGDAPPYFVIMLGFILAILRIASAYSVWQNQRWSLIVMLLANVLDTLSAVPGIFFAPTIYLQRSATVGVMLGIVLSVLCLWRERRTALE